MAKKVLIGKHFRPAHDHYVGKIGRDRNAFLEEDHGRPLYGHISKSFECGPPQGYGLLDRGILNKNFSIKGSSTF